MKKGFGLIKLYETQKHEIQKDLNFSERKHFWILFKRGVFRWGKEVDLGPIQVCEVCGYTLEGEAPDRCPICNALKEKFTAFE